MKYSNRSYEIISEAEDIPENIKKNFRRGIHFLQKSLKLIIPLDLPIELKKNLIRLYCDERKRAIVRDSIWWKENVGSYYEECLDCVISTNKKRAYERIGESK